MADDDMWKMYGEAVTRINEPLIREERRREAARAENEAAEARSRAVMDDALRLISERMANGTLR